MRTNTVFTQICVWATVFSVSLQPNAFPAVGRAEWSAQPSHLAPKHRNPEPKALARMAQLRPLTARYGLEKTEELLDILISKLGEEDQNLQDILAFSDRWVRLVDQLGYDAFVLELKGMPGDQVRFFLLSPQLSKAALLDRVKALAWMTRSKATPGILFPELLFSDRFWRMKSEYDRYPILERAMRSPRPYFYYRPGIEERIENFPRATLNPRDLENILMIQDSAVLGGFESLASPKGIVARFNTIYFGAYGSEVFRLPTGNVPAGVTNDPVLMQALARMIYARLMKLPPEEMLVVHLWGFGGVLRGSSAMARELERLDANNTPRLADRLRYVVSDAAVTMVEEGPKRAATDKVLADWMRRGILRFRVLDAANPPKELHDGVDIVISSYLYDCFPQRLIVKRGTSLYEIKARPILQPKSVQAKDGTSVPAEKFRELLLKNDIAGLSQLDPRAFASVHFEQILEPLDAAKEPMGTELLALEGDGIIPMGEGMIESLRRTLPTLKAGGEIFTLDHVVEWPGPAARGGTVFNHFLGAVYAPLGALALRRFAEESGAVCDISAVEDWLEGMHRDRLVTLVTLRFQEDEASLRLYFPIYLLRNYSRIAAAARRITYAKGYSEKGLKKFREEVQKALGPGVVLGEWRTGIHRDYLDDLQTTVNAAIRDSNYLVESRKDGGWLLGKGKNQAFLNATAKLGFDGRLVKHLLAHRKALNKQLNFFAVRLSRGPSQGPLAVVPWPDPQFPVLFSPVVSNKYIDAVFKSPRRGFMAPGPDDFLSGGKPVTSRLIELQKTGRGDFLRWEQKWIRYIEKLAREDKHAELVRDLAQFGALPPLNPVKASMENVVRKQQERYRAAEPKFIAALKRKVRPDIRHEERKIEDAAPYARLAIQMEMQGLSLEQILRLTDVMRQMQTGSMTAREEFEMLHWATDPVRKELRDREFTEEMMNLLHERRLNRLFASEIVQELIADRIIAALTVAFLQDPSPGEISGDLRKDVEELVNMYAPVRTEYMLQGLEILAALRSPAFLELWREAGMDGRPEVLQLALEMFHRRVGVDTGKRPSPDAFRDPDKAGFLDAYKRAVLENLQRPAPFRTLALQELLRYPSLPWTHGDVLRMISIARPLQPEISPDDPRARTVVADVVDRLQTRGLSALVVGNAQNRQRAESQEDTLLRDPGFRMRAAVGTIVERLATQELSALVAVMARNGQQQEIKSYVSPDLSIVALEMLAKQLSNQRWPSEEKAGLAFGFATLLEMLDPISQAGVMARLQATYPAIWLYVQLGKGKPSETIQSVFWDLVFQDAGVDDWRKMTSREFDKFLADLAGSKDTLERLEQFIHAWIEIQNIRDPLHFGVHAPRALPQAAVETSTLAPASMTSGDDGKAAWDETVETLKDDKERALEFLRRFRPFFEPFWNARALFPASETAQDKRIWEGLQGRSFEMDGRTVTLDASLVRGLQFLGSRSGNELSKLTGLRKSEWYAFLWSLFVRTHMEIKGTRDAFAELASPPGPDAYHRQLIAQMMVLFPSILKERKLSLRNFPPLTAFLMDRPLSAGVGGVEYLAYYFPEDFVRSCDLQTVPALPISVSHDDAASGKLQVDASISATKALEKEIRRVEGIPAMVQENLRIIRSPRTQQPAARLEAAEYLSKNGPRSVVKDLTDQLLDEPMAGMRLKLMACIVQMVQDALKPSPEMMEQFGRLRKWAPTEEQALIRREFAKVIQYVHHRYSLEILLGFLEDPDPQVRKQALENVLDYPEPKAVEVVALMAEEDADETVKSAALTALLSALDPSKAQPKSQDILCSLIATSSWPYRREAVRALAEYPNEKSVDILVAVLTDETDAQLQTEALQVLAAMFESPEFAPHALSEKTRKYVRRDLAFLLKDPHAQPRVLVAGILSHVGDDETVQALEAARKEGLNDAPILKRAIQAIQARREALTRFEERVSALRKKANREVRVAELEELEQWAAMVPWEDVSKPLLTRFEELLKRLSRDFKVQAQRIQMVSGIGIMAGHFGISRGAAQRALESGRELRELTHASL